ncbi:unnamed protein product [Mesocestoides corti]|uniref:Uncharacterized protein n=1 Tax=Mesocestoides corti TaxID=53468 RepID=A0A0R3U3Q6_MESCO|nr:unnamed protein product [Mesocestoides corti]
MSFCLLFVPLQTYSEKLEKLADNWASRCRYDYPDTEPGYENTGMYKIVSVDRKPTFEEVGQTAMEASSKNDKYGTNDWKYRPDQLMPTATTSASTIINAMATLQAAILSFSYFF